MKKFREFIDLKKDKQQVLATDPTPAPAPPAPANGAGTSTTGPTMLAAPSDSDQYRFRRFAGVNVCSIHLSFLSLLIYHTILRWDLGSSTKNGSAPPYSQTQLPPNNRISISVKGPVRSSLPSFIRTDQLTPTHRCQSQPRKALGQLDDHLRLGIHR